MFHRRCRLRLSQKPSLARSMLRNLATSFLLYERIRTTRKRAKVVQPIIERLMHTANKSSEREAIRALHRIVTDRNASRKLIEVYKGRFGNRSSGFTRIIPVGARKGDGAEMVDLVLTDQSVPKSKSSKTTSLKSSS